MCFFESSQILSLKWSVFLKSSSICHFSKSGISVKTESKFNLKWKNILYLFWVYFLYGINWWSSFTFLRVPAQFSQHHLLKRLFLLHCILPCPLCQILIDHKDVGWFLDSLFCFLDLCVCSYASTRLFWLQWPCTIVWYQVLWSFLLCSSFSRLLRLFRVIFGSM